MNLNPKPETRNLILILLSGFALRLFRLGAQSLWYDETVSAVLARKSTAALIAHTARDIHPPGYYLLLHGWRALAGDTEFALAFFSVIFGMLLIVTVYALAKRLAGAPAGLWAAGLVAFSPYNLWYSQEVRMYTLGAWLGMLAVIFALMAFAPAMLSARPLTVSRRRWAIGYALIAALGLYVLYYFAFLLIALNLFFVFWWGVSLRRWETKNLADLASLRLWTAANFGAAILYLPWVPIAWRQATQPPVPPWRSTVPLGDMLLESWNALSVGESIQPAQVWWALGVTAILFALGIIAARRPAPRFLLPALTFLPLGIIIAAPLVTGSPLYHVRYLFTYSPPFYIILGMGLAWLWARRRGMAVVAAGVWLAASVWAMAELHTNPRYAADDLRGAVAILEEKWRPGDVILVNAGYTYTALRVYFSAPTAGYLRLTDFDPQTTRNPYAPLVLETGTVDGDPALGWGDPQSDFYAMTAAETIAALERVGGEYPRIWMLRAYDTVTDPQGVIRRWLAENTRLVDDTPIAGPSFFRVQAFDTGAEPNPPYVLDATFGGKLHLRGIVPLGQQYRPGEAIFVTWWLDVVGDVSADAPIAVSLKLWDAQGNLAAQVDEWAAGNQFFSPRWRAGDAIRYPMRLDVPKTLPAGQYWLDLIFYRTDTGEPLPVDETGKTGVTLGQVEIIGK